MKLIMTDCGLQELGQSTVNEFERRLAALPSEACWSSHEEAKRLEIELLTVYRAAALCVRDLEELESIANVWRVMVEVCDRAATQLGELVKTHPTCGAEIYYDRVLDLRNKCRRLQNLHA